MVDSSEPKEDPDTVVIAPVFKTFVEEQKGTKKEVMIAPVTR